MCVREREVGGKIERVGETKCVCERESGRGEREWERQSVCL